MDVHEYQKLLKKWDSIDALEERLYHDVRRNSSGASMTPAGHSRRNVVSSNDPNETFDILIQSLKTSSGSSSSSSSDGGGNGGGPRGSPTHHHRRSAMDTADMDDEYEAAYEDGGDGAKPSIRKSFPLSSASSPLRGTRRSTTPTSTQLRHGGSVSPSKRMATRGVSSSSTSPHLDTLYGELETLQQQVQLLTKKLANQSLAGNVRNVPGYTPTMKPSPRTPLTLPTPTIGTPAEVERLDWRIALGDVSMHLRRELADKVSREELLSLLRDEAALLAQKVKPLEVVLEKEWSVLSKTLPATVHQVQQDLMVMQQRVAAEIQGARFLWTSGRYTALTVGSGGSGGVGGAGVLSASCWVPWERQVINASPQVLLWRRDSPVITVKVPGLYVLTVSIFTTNLQAVARVLVYLNDEPLCQLRTTAPPTTTATSNGAPVRVSPTTSSSSSASALVGLGGSQVTPMVTPITKYRHSLGDVCSYTMEEYVSLPPEARLTVCILPSSVTFAMDSATGVGGSEDSGRAIGAQSAPQGFLALRKL